jgi:ABC-type microcin C transport system permease subunit YejE
MQVGGAIGVAAFGALVSGATAEQITSWLNISALTAAALLIIATLIALSVRGKRDPRHDESMEPPR